jgi:D-xylose transport system ATP-binding protein
VITCAPRPVQLPGAQPSPAVPFLRLSGISKRFGAVQALSEVDFEVYVGEVVGLVGDNRAGKSTLIKIIAGIHPADAGSIEFHGEPVTTSRPTDVVRLGIATVYQDLALCDNLDVVANLFLGREQVSPLHFLDEVDMERKAIDVLEGLSVTIPSVRTPVASPSGGQRQSVVQTRQVLDLIKRLREQGLGVVVISHNLAEIFDVCDRIVVLRLGRRVATFAVPETEREDVVAAITGAQYGQGASDE